MAEFERIEKVSYLRIFTHNINKRKFMISCCECTNHFKATSLLKVLIAWRNDMPCFNISKRKDLQLGASSLPLDCAYYIHTCNI